MLHLIVISYLIGWVLDNKTGRDEHWNQTPQHWGSSSRTCSNSSSDNQTKFDTKDIKRKDTTEEWYEKDKEVFKIMKTHCFPDSFRYKEDYPLDIQASLISEFNTFESFRY